VARRRWNKPRNRPKSRLANAKRQLTLVFARPPGPLAGGIRIGRAVAAAGLGVRKFLSE
jgi:hypothetical protein